MKNVFLYIYLDPYTYDSEPRARAYADFNSSMVNE